MTFLCFYGCLRFLQGRAGRVLVYRGTVLNWCRIGAQLLEFVGWNMVVGTASSGCLYLLICKSPVVILYYVVCCVSCIV
jgi:hypothetical protein